ncbi:MAG: mannose-1-phosphate guanylyltransferase [Candidatus Hydrogenedentes bacterium]|nr:mannose-1-phosphate guanylyltransferase [Candidatus Hydrogenedentota bacterium]
MAKEAVAQRVGVILAGGSGERFWPLSRRRLPKQLLRLTSPDQTMLGEAVARVAPLIPREHIYIVTGEHLVDPIRDAGVGIPDANILAEPAKRNTAGALSYAAAYLLSKYGGDGSALTMAVTTADHTIGDADRFCGTVEAALEAAEREGALATLGVVPTRPETGFGYIQISENAKPLASRREGYPVYPVKAFHEKPSQEVAEDFIATGHYFWNSGMFFWKISSFLAELERPRPDFTKAIHAMTEALRHNDSAKVREIFEGLEDISIDYALMEHARNVVVARADFPWDDVGAWNALDRAQAHDADGNVAIGQPIVVDSKDCIVYNDTGQENMAVCVVGCEELIVVATKDAVLVIPKDRAQDVRHAVQELKRRNAPQV